MKCTTCGQALSLRMTHCAGCGTPTSYAARPQSISFAASPYATPRQTSSEQHGYAQPSQYRQESRMNNAPQLAPTKKRRWGGFFLLIIVVCVLLLFGMGIYKLVRIANTTSTVKQASTPSGNVLIPAASLILKDAQTSSDIDTTLAPTQITKTFMANQKVYVTFTITSRNQDAPPDQSRQSGMKMGKLSRAQSSPICMKIRMVCSQTYTLPPHRTEQLNYTGVRKLIVKMLSLLKSSISL